MELREARTFGNGGTGRRPTHDFLSLYTHSTVPQDPSPSSQGGYLKTHDFLQPLERVGKTRTKEEIPVVEKPPPPTPPPSVEHILPGGIGTYSISHISYLDQVVAKPEGSMFTAAQASSTERNDENSNCSSYTGSGFTIREESAVKKGKTGKENTAERSAGRDIPVKLGQWTPERPSVSSSNNHRNSFSSLSSSQPLGQKNQSFMEMIKSAKDSTQEDEMDDANELVLKAEPSSTHKGELRVKVDGKRPDQKASTPRSKHSATEQRRRSKINDRFHMLRELIPHSDQKRDKASFLLEVIEYIQFLQEKVHKYEVGSYQGWHNDPEKLTPWRNHRPAESFADQSRGLNSGSSPALMFDAKFDAKFDEKNVTISHTIPATAQNPVESDMSAATTFRTMNHHPGMTHKGLTFPTSLQPKIFTSVRSGGTVTQLPSRIAFEAENMASQPQPQLCQARSCASESAVASEKLKERDLTIEGGTISISSVYSQGLLNTLTQALQSSGVDLSQASISVQIDIGKRADSRITSVKTMVKDNSVPSCNQGATHSRVTSGDASNQVLKRLKTGRS